MVKRRKSAENRPPDAPDPNSVSDQDRSADRTTQALSLTGLAMMSICLLAAILVTHGPGLRGVWLMDDFEVLLENPQVTRWNPLGILLASRGFAFLSLQLNYRIGGAEIFGYHVFNLAVHVLAAFSLWAFMRELFVRRSAAWPSWVAERPEVIAFSTALLWAVHPINTQPVSYIIQRMESMWSAIFFLGCYLFFHATHRSCKRRYLLYGSLPCFWIGMGCKEPILFASFFLPIADWVFTAKNQQSDWNRKRYYATLFVPVLVVAGVLAPRLLDSSESSSGGLFTQVFTPVEYWSTQPEALGVYLTRFLSGAGNNFDYLWLPQKNPVLLLFEWGLLAFLVVTTLRALWRRRSWAILPTMFFACVFTTSAVPLIDLVVEYRVYAASSALVALTLLAATLLMTWVNGRWIHEDTSEDASKRQAWVTRGLMLFVVLWGGFLGYQCHARSRLYASAVDLWRDSVNKAPWNYRAHINLALALSDQDQDAAAVEHCRLAFETETFRRQPPHQQAKVYDALAYSLSNLGDFDEAVEAAEQAVALTPTGSRHLVRLAQVYADQRQWSLADATMERAIENRPGKWSLRSKRALILAASQQWEAASREVSEAKRLAGGKIDELERLEAQLAWMLGDQRRAAGMIDSMADQEARTAAWIQLADWLATAERWNEQEAVLARVQGAAVDTRSQLKIVTQRYLRAKLSQDHALAAQLASQAVRVAESDQEKTHWQVELALSQIRGGNQNEGDALLSQLSKTSSDQPVVWAGLGDAQRLRGDVENAIRSYQNALSLGLRDTNLFNNLGSLMSRTDPVAGESYLRRSVEMDPGNYQAWHSLGNCLVRQQRLADALACYQQAVTIRPDFSPSAKMLIALKNASAQSTAKPSARNP